MYVSFQGRFLASLVKSAGLRNDACGLKCSTTSVTALPTMPQRKLIIASWTGDLGNPLSFKSWKLALLLLFAAGAIAQTSAPAAPPATAPAAQQPAQSSASTSGAPAQPATDPNAPPSDDNVATIRTTTNEVNVVFTVTDKKGKRVTDLKQNDFRVVDDNKPPEEIRSFHAEANLPLQVGLLIDASNSVRDRFKFEQESAIEFLNQTVRPRYDRAFVVGFDATPEVTQDFTDNTDFLGDRFPDPGYPRRSAVGF